jgi:hypothetical protein
VQDDAPPDRTAILETAFETTLDSSERFALMSSVLNEHYRNGVCTGLTATALQAFKDGGRAGSWCCGRRPSGFLRSTSRASSGMPCPWMSGQWRPSRIRRWGSTSTPGWRSASTGWSRGGQPSSPRRLSGSSSAGTMAGWTNSRRCSGRRSTWCSPSTAAPASGWARAA